MQDSAFFMVICCEILCTFWRVRSKRTKGISNENFCSKKLQRPIYKMHPLSQLIKRGVLSNGAFFRFVLGSMRLSDVSEIIMLRFSGMGHAQGKPGNGAAGTAKAKSLCGAGIYPHPCHYTQSIFRRRLVYLLQLF